jgi:serine/threonine protein kinase
MRVHSPSRRESIAVAGRDPLSVGQCAGDGTAFGLDGDATIEYRPDRPQVIGRFQLLEKAGAGAFGTVWKARDKDLDRTVAIKVPRQGQLDAREANRFLQEARTSGQLRHPNIVSVHEVGRQGDTVYIVADYIDGQTLADWLVRRRPTVRQAAELCRKIAEAVHYAHEAGVIHRDLKPSNIMVDASGEPQVTDFGLARRTAEEVTMTAEGQILGTPAYMSPEQLQGDNRHVDHRADLYALGVILFELLTGERPFRGSVQMLVGQVIEKEAPSPRELDSNVPRDLEKICMKCLEKDPRRRYRHAGALAEDLGRFLEGMPVTARSISPPVRFWRWCKRNRLAAGLTAALFLVLLVGLAVTTSQWLRAQETAAREAETRSEIETLTRQLLELAERLRNLEDSQSRAGLSAFPRAEGRKDAELRFSYSRLSEAPKSARGLRQLEEPEPRAELRLIPPEDPGECAKLGRAPSQPKETSEIAGLRAEAKATLQRLEELSPTVAERCRGALPELVGD